MRGNVQGTVENCGKKNKKDGKNMKKRGNLEEGGNYKSTKVEKYWKLEDGDKILGLY